MAFIMDSSASVRVARKTVATARAEACGLRRCRPAALAQHEIDCPMPVQCVARWLGGIGPRERPSQQGLDLRELPRHGQEQQNDDEQIGQLGHRVSLGTARPRASHSDRRSVAIIGTWRTPGASPIRRTGGPLTARQTTVFVNCASFVAPTRLRRAWLPRCGSWARDSHRSPGRW